MVSGQTVNTDNSICHDSGPDPDIFLKQFGLLTSFHSANNKEEKNGGDK